MEQGRQAFPRLLPSNTHCIPFPLEWFIGLLCAFFIASRTSKYFAFRVAKPTDRPIFIILCIQTFTVCTMVPLMSLLGTIESSVNHFKPDFYLAPDHLSEFHYGLPTADLSCWSVLPLHIPSPVRLHQPRK